jgi:Sulfotransferase domain
MLKTRSNPETNIKLLPNLVIIGAMKAGTTSLHSYLDLHPQIFMSRIKELNFFVEGENWLRGLEWYKSNFDRPAQIIGESSPNYTKYPFFKGVAQRMHRAIPDAKLIYIVRDPMKRIVSHYIHRVADGLEKRSFAEALADDWHTNHVISSSQYYRQLEQYLNYYSPERILVISLEDLARDRTNTLQSVFRFLEVDPDFQHEDFSQVLHSSGAKLKVLTPLGARLSTVPGGKLMQSALFRIVGGARASQWLYRRIEQPVLDESLRQKLVDFLAEDVAKLTAFTGRAFPDWSL